MSLNFFLPLLAIALLVGILTGLTRAQVEDSKYLTVFMESHREVFAKQARRDEIAWRRLCWKARNEDATLTIDYQHFSHLTAEARDGLLFAGEEKRVYRRIAFEARLAWIQVMEDCHARAMLRTRGHPALANFTDLAELRFEKAIWAASRITYSPDAEITNLMSYYRELAKLELRLEAMSICPYDYPYKVNPGYNFRKYLIPALGKLPDHATQNLLAELSAILDDLERLPSLHPKIR
jgi:hypothetical protein